MSKQIAIPLYRSAQMIDVTIARHLLFQVIAEGREYSIYTDGSVEGFGEKAIINNHFPSLAEEYHQSRLHPSAEALRARRE